MKRILLLFAASVVVYSQLLVLSGSRLTDVNMLGQVVQPFMGRAHAVFAKKKRWHLMPGDYCIVHGTAILNIQQESPKDVMATVSCVPVGACPTCAIYNAYWAKREEKDPEPGPPAEFEKACENYVHLYDDPSKTLKGVTPDSASLDYPWFGQSLPPNRDYPVCPIGSVVLVRKAAIQKDNVFFDDHKDLLTDSSVQGVGLNERLNGFKQPKPKQP